MGFTQWGRGKSTFGKLPAQSFMDYKDSSKEVLGRDKNAQMFER